MLIKRSRVQIKAWVLTGLVVGGLAGLTGCGSKLPTAPSNSTNTTALPSSTNGGYQQFQPTRYTSSPSLTKKWMKIDTATHSLTISFLLTGKDLSLNGYYHGFAEIKVPIGWKINLSFLNNNPYISGKLAVVGTKHFLSSTVQPAISGAITPSAANDHSGPAIAQFTAMKLGTYVVEFAPTVQGGTWMWFVVGSKSTTPQVELRK